MELPDDKGTYILIVSVERMKRLEIGRLGVFDVVPGFYAYVGSAVGSGGIRARVGHHLESVAAPHWHIDYLLGFARPVEVWFAMSDRRLEQDWAELLEDAPGFRTPIPRFGSSDSPNPGHGHHEFRNAETGLRVGVALGRAMVELLERGKAALPSKGAKPTGHVARTIEGWTVRVDDRLLAPPHDEAGRRAPRFLDELAHAYHDQVLGFDNPRIRAAYEAFRRGGHGDQALLHDGTRTRDYGLTDPKEFFAEMTEAFFGGNDFQPFNRAELRTAEPAIYDLIESVWREEAPVTTQ